jgi:WD40 repeat protein
LSILSGWGWNEEAVMAESDGGTAPFTGHLGPVCAVAYSPDGTTLTTTGGDRTVGLSTAR